MTRGNKDVLDRVGAPDQLTHNLRIGFSILERQFCHCVAFLVPFAACVARIGTERAERGGPMSRRSHFRSHGVRQESARRCERPRKRLLARLTECQQLEARRLMTYNDHDSYPDVYGGCSGFNFSFQLAPVPRPPSVTPGAASNPNTSGEQATPATANPVRFVDGTPVIVSQHLLTGGFGDERGLTSAWTNRVTGPLENNWVISDQPYLAAATATRPTSSSEPGLQPSSTVTAARRHETDLVVQSIRRHMTPVPRVYSHYHLGVAARAIHEPAE
jgi:hypothetical protein